MRVPLLRDKVSAQDGSRRGIRAPQRRTPHPPAEHPPPLPQTRASTIAYPNASSSVLLTDRKSLLI